MLVEHMADVVIWGPELNSIVGVDVAALEVRRVLYTCNSKYI